MKIRRREIDYPTALWRRRWWIVPFVLLGLVVSLVVFARLPRLYRAQATVILISQTISKEIYQGAWRFPGGRLKNVQQTVNSMSLLEAAAEELGMDDLKGQDLWQIVNGFSVEEVDPETFLFIKVGPNPTEVARRANAVARAFVQETQNKKLENTEVSSEFLVDEVARLQKDLADQRERLASYQAKHKGELPSDRETHRAEQTFLRTRISELDARLESKRKDLRQRQELLQAPESASQTDLPDPGALPRDPRHEKVEKLRQELGEARLRYTERHPQVVRIQASLDALLQEIRENPYPLLVEDSQVGVQEEAGAAGAAGQPLHRYVQLEMSRIRQEIDELSAERERALVQVQELERQIQASYLRQSEVDAINRQIALLETRLVQNQNKLQSLETEREVFERGMDERFALKAEAGVPMLPFSPDLLQLLLMGIGIGAGVGVGLALLRELMDSSVWTAEEVEELLQTEILAVIPNMDRERRQRPRQPPPGPVRRKRAHG